MLYAFLSNLAESLLRMKVAMTSLRACLVSTLVFFLTAVTLPHASQAQVKGDFCPVPVQPKFSGGCQLYLTSGTNCQTLPLSSRGDYEFGWSTNTTFCEGPHTIVIGGSPPDTWLNGTNWVSYQVVSTGSANWFRMIRNVGGYALITPADLAGLTTDNGQFYWGVQSFYGSLSGSGTFYLQGRTAANTTAPTVPTGLTATPASATQINLSWTASTDGVGVTAYKVYRGGSLLATLGNVTSYNDTGLIASTAYSYTLSACNATGNCSAQSTTASATTTTTTITAVTSRLINIATRGQIQTGDNVMIGGFIIQGSAPKTVLVRARGPDLSNFGVPGALSDPMLTLYSGQSVIASNDNWQSDAAAEQAITATGYAPANAKESAVLNTLNPGAYTAIVSGVGGATGVGIVEVFEVDHPEVPLVNIATRALVQTGDNVMIGGFIISGTAPQTVLIRARGPDLTNYGVPGALANPTLSLYTGQTVIATNDDWGSASNAQDIQASGLAPANSLESAILMTLQPGAYTVIVSGVGGGTGVGIVEVFAR